MKNRLLYVISGLALLVFMSCGKDDTVSVESATNKLLNKRWILTSSVSIDSNGVEKDIFTPLPEYRKDDYFQFNADSSYEFNDNVELRSDSVSPIIDAGKWAFTRGGTYLELYSSFFNTTYEPALVQTLSDTELFLERRYTSDRSIIRTRYRSQP